MKIFKAFDALSTFLFCLVIVMLFTGGQLWILGKTKIEMIALDLWIFAALIFAGIAYKVGKQPTTFYHYAIKVFSYLKENQVQSRKFALGFMFFILGTLFFAHWGKHWSLMTDAWDMGFVHPALFQPFESPLLKCDLCLNQSFLGEHISFTMLLPGLLFQFIQSDILIFLLEVILIGVGSYLIIFKGPLEKSNRLLLLIAVVALFSSRALRNSLIWDFREDHLAFLFLSMALYCLYQKKIFSYLVTLILTLISKEHIGLMTFFLAIPIYYERKFDFDRRTRIFLASATALFSLVYVIVAFKMLIPYFAAGGESHNNIVYLFGKYGNSPAEIMMHVLVTPSAMIELIGRIFLNAKALKYLAIILVGPLFLGYKRWWWIFPVMAGLSLNLLPLSDNYKMMIFHYELAIYPYIAMWIVLSLSDIDLQSQMNRVIWITVIFVALSGRWPMHNLRKYFFVHSSEALALNTLNSNSIVLANSKVLSHLNHFQGIRPLHQVHGWESFNATYSSNVDSGRSRAHNFNMIVFDLRNDYEKKLYESSLNNGWENVKDWNMELVVRPVVRVSDKAHTHSAQ